MEINEVTTKDLVAGPCSHATTDSQAYRRFAANIATSTFEITMEVLTV